MNALSTSGLGPTSISQFAHTLPESYRERFSPAEIAAHAHIVRLRGEGVLAVGRFPWGDPSVTAVCVSALDRPGLLALISRALSEVGFQVKAAEAFCRVVEPKEALDFFWLDDPEGRINDAEVEAFAALLEEALEGRRPEVVPNVGPAPGAGTTVRFLENSGGTLSVLEVETLDRSGLLWAITQALHKSGVQIVGSQIRTEAARVLDRFSIEELTGEPISDERRWQIQVAVLSALEM